MLSGHWEVHCAVKNKTPDVLHTSPNRPGIQKTFNGDRLHHHVLLPSTYDRIFTVVGEPMIHGLGERRVLIVTSLQHVEDSTPAASGYREFRKSRSALPSLEGPREVSTEGIQVGH